MKNDIQEVLLTEAEIQAKVKELGKIISEEYKDKNPLLVCILKGGVVFMADLMRAIDIPIEIDFMAVSSYGSETITSGEVKILKDLNRPVANRHILFVEDIVDSGKTLYYLTNLFKTRNAASVKTVTLLDKPDRRAVDFQVDWYGFEIPDEFLIGYGLDYDEKYRHLPDISVLKPDVYQT